MTKLSRDAIRELRQSLPVLERLEKLFARPHLLTGDEIRQLKRAYDRVSELTSSAEVRTWVGSIWVHMVDQDQDWELWSTNREVTENARTFSERLYTYVQERLESEKVEELLDRLTQENASLKEQLAELRQRESIYLSIIGEVETPAAYSLSPQSREILLNSLRRQETTLTKNLSRLREAKVKYGLNVPLDILNGIDQTQAELEQITASIASLEEAA